MTKFVPYYQKAYNKFARLIKRKVMTAEAGLEELNAAHEIMNGYGSYEREPATLCNKALEEWGAKWEGTPYEHEIYDLMEA